VLLENYNPIGGKGIFDIENRKKILKDINPPENNDFAWPINYKQAKNLLEQFLNKKFKNFRIFRS
jgi:deoxyribodipyrimidine photolyase-like uncharacterized protein